MSHEHRTLEVVAIARVCHEANKAYCESMGDTSQSEWRYCEEWQRESAIDGVLNAMAGATSEQSHENWLEAKVAAGWRCGNVKDSEKKEHPCMVPYAQLPEFQKKKDALFLAIVGTLATV